ncbi:MAG: HAD-IA family hydrolase [Betaproteobacteria bacterium]|nr:HAD-IA family hydrolase [Betaproteobacteria bacterium]
MQPRPGIQALLFDLDGTFIDSAPGMAGAANGLRALHGLPPLEAHLLRAGINSGARGMLQLALSMAPTHPDYALWREKFYDFYESHLPGGAHWMPGVEPLVGHLEACGIAWGIVTNKASRFALPICEELGIARRAACIVCGDTTPHTKPHPGPLHHAAASLGVASTACAYVGDDRRDVTAARAAGMHAIAARYGFVAPGDDPATWGADAIIDYPADLMPCFEWPVAAARHPPR